LMGGGSQQQQTTTTQQLTPEQQSLVSLATPQYQQFAASNPTLPTGDQAVAPFNPNQTAGQSGVVGSTGQMGSTVGTAAGTENLLSSGQFLDPASNPVVQNAVKAATDPIFQDLSQRTLPTQQATAASGSGTNYGGSREGIAEGLDVQGAQRAAGQAGANIMNTALGQGLTATGQAIAQAPATAGSLALPGATQEAVGTEQQTQQQNVLNANNAAQMFAQLLPLLKAQELTQGAAGLPGGSTTAVGTGSTDPGMFADLLGGATAAGGLLGGIGKLGGSAGLSGLLGGLGGGGAAAAGGGSELASLLPLLAL
jgi:hypothetical protein